jgi:hypothetical protein
MSWFKRSSRFNFFAIVLAVALVLGLAVHGPAGVQAQLKPNSLSSKLPDRWENSFRPPRTFGSGAPINTIGGGTRGDCEPSEKPPIPLVPASNMGATAAGYPTFFWYMPQTKASGMEFLLQDAENNEVYRVEYTLDQSTGGVTDTPKIMSLTLPAFANISPLAIGQEYRWSLALICRAADRSGDLVVESGIKRIATNPALAQQIQRATPQDRVGLYADARLWHETVGTLLQLRRDRPNNQEVETAWQKLLQSAGLSLSSEIPGD